MKNIQIYIQEFPYVNVKSEESNVPIEENCFQGADHPNAPLDSQGAVLPEPVINLVYYYMEMLLLYNGIGL